MAHHAIVLYAGKQLTCLSPCQYYEYSFHCIHAIWICVKYCKALIYSIYFNVLKLTKNKFSQIITEICFNVLNY